LAITLVVYLKIDTQGFESKVLKGAEMSLVPPHKDELLFDELHNFFKNNYTKENNN